MSMNASRHLLSLSSWKILLLFMGSGPASTRLGAGRAASASRCAAASMAHQLSQPDEERAASSSGRGQANPYSGRIAVALCHHSSKCKYSDTQSPVSQGVTSLSAAIGHVRLTLYLLQISKTVVKLFLIRFYTSP